MSLLGTRQISKLTFAYCKTGGSSRGMREFIENNLPALKQALPDVKYAVQMKPNKHPTMRAEYVHGNVQEVPCRNDDTKAIQVSMAWLTDSFGLPVEKIKKRHVGATAAGNTLRGRSRSIQGAWTPFWDAGNPKGKVKRALGLKPAAQ